MIKFKRICVFILLVSNFLLIFPHINVSAKDNKNVYIRVEGLHGTIIEGKSYGNTIFDALENLLNERGILYILKGEEKGAEKTSLAKVGDLAVGHFGRNDRWMHLTINNYYVNYKRIYLREGDEIIFYYGEEGYSSIVNNLTFKPDIPMINEEFILKLGFSSFYGDLHNLSGIKILIDGKEYFTENNGEIKLNLDKGTHSFEISDYGDNKIPRVIKMRGSFEINGKEQPIISFSNEKYLRAVDENIIEGKVKSKLKESMNFFENNFVSPWGAFSLNKKGWRINEDFMTEFKFKVKSGINTISTLDLIEGIIGIVSLGYSPYDFLGVNLISELYSRDISRMSNYEIIYLLLLYRSLNLSEEYIISEEILVNKVLEAYMEGWVHNKEDISALAISALSPYYNGKEISGVNNSEVNRKVKLAIDKIKNRELNNREIINWILALTSLGISPIDNNNLGDKLLDNIEKGHRNKEIPLVEENLSGLLALEGYFEEGVYDYYSSNIDLNNLSVYKEMEVPKTGDNNKYMYMYMVSFILGAYCGISLLKKISINK